jgi:hypothetical protein
MFNHERTVMKVVWGIFGSMLVMLMGSSCGTRTMEFQRPVESGRVLPTIQERLTERVLTGTLITKNGNEFVVRDVDADLERTVLVDQRIKLDAVATGETVRIYMTDEGQATTVQRVTE